MATLNAVLAEADALVGAVNRTPLVLRAPNPWDPYVLSGMQLPGASTVAWSDDARVSLGQVYHAAARADTGMPTSDTGMAVGGEATGRHADQPGGDPHQRVYR